MLPYWVLNKLFELLFPELILYYYLGKTVLSILPITPWIYEVFYFDAKETIPNPGWGIFPLIWGRGDIGFTGLKQLPHMHALSWSQLKARGGPSTNLLSKNLSPLYSALWTLFLGLFGLPALCTLLTETERFSHLHNDLESLQAVSRGNYKAHLICFPISQR